MNKIYRFIDAIIHIEEESGNEKLALTLKELKQKAFIAGYDEQNVEEFAGEVWQAIDDYVVRIMDSEYDRGFDEGKQQGYEDGYNEGYNEALEDY